MFAFSAKIGLKSAKNVVFCILCMPMEGGYSLPPPPPLATLLNTRDFEVAVSGAIWVKGLKPL